jgi:lipopolysaccharide biosynthesis glycosyltransferase
MKNTQLKSEIDTDFSDYVNIVLASDQNFMPYAAVTMASILNSYNDTRHLRIFLLLNETFSNKNRKRFAKLQTIRSFDMIEVPADTSEFADILTKSWFTAATFSRLLMHELLPRDIDKIIYLDSDLLVLNCIGKLYDHPISRDVLFAGVEGWNSVHKRKAYGMPPDAPNINTGVMIVNLDLMRASNFSQKVRTFIASTSREIKLADQEIINSVFHNQISYIPLKWNVYQKLWKRKWVMTNAGIRNSFTIDEVMSAALSPSIVHFAGQNKPWMSYAHPWSRKWLHYLQMTPYEKEVRMSMSHKLALLWQPAVIAWKKMSGEVFKGPV